MKIKTGLFMLGAIGVLGATSCKKCTTCEYTNQFNEKITTNETCGNKDDRAAFETEMQETWGTYGDVNCTE